MSPENSFNDQVIKRHRTSKSDGVSRKRFHVSGYKSYSTKTTCAGGRNNVPPPRASGDTIYMMHAYGSVTNCMSMLAWLDQPTKAAWWLWPFDLESGVRVICDVGYLCANFSLPRPLCSRLRPDVRDRRQTDRRQTLIIAYEESLVSTTANIAVVAYNTDW